MVQPDLQSPGWFEGPLPEVIHFAKKGKPASTFRRSSDTIFQGRGAQSWQMENRYKTMNGGNFRFFGFAVEDVMRQEPVLSVSAEPARQTGCEPCRWTAPCVDMPSLILSFKLWRQALGTRPRPAGKGWSAELERPLRWSLPQRCKF